MPDQPRAGVMRHEMPTYDTWLHRDLATEVLHHLHRQGMTQKLLAIRCDLSEKHVSQVLTGKAEGSFETWQAFARVLGMRWEIGLV